jgi:hypothetical protein
VTVGSEVGGLRVHGLNGTITVTAFAEIEGTVVSAKVKCGNEELETEALKHSSRLIPVSPWRRIILLMLEAIRRTFSRNQ